MRPTLLFVVLLFGLSPVSWADSEAQAWLDKMNRAVDTLNYQGVFIFRHGRRVETMRIVHGYDEGGERERLVSLTGEPREIIRDKDALTCIWPGSKSVVVEPRSRYRGFPANVLDAQARPNYQYSVEGVDRVAGLSCRKVSVVPEDDFRYGYRLCISEDSGMLLRSELIGVDGDVVEQVMFTSFELLDEVPDEALKSRYSGEGYTLHEASRAKHEAEYGPDPGWKLTDLPRGFELSSNVKRPMAANLDLVQHMVLTDGLASVSVFIAEEGPMEDRYQGVTSSGALHAFADINHGHQITVVGEVPEVTVTRIGEGLRYEPNGEANAHD